MTIVESHRYVLDVERVYFAVLEAEGLEGLRDLLISQGLDRVLAGRIAWFIADHAARVDDGLSPGTRVNYRRTLRSLELGLTAPGHNRRTRPQDHAPVMDEVSVSAA